MRANLYFNSTFIIETLPHDQQYDGEDSIYGAIEEGEPVVILVTAHGETHFTHFKQVGENRYKVWGPAEYYGAWNALNACNGIKFPDCTISNIVSTYGCYDTVDEYLAARILIRHMQALIHIGANKSGRVPPKVVKSLVESLISSSKEMPYPSCGDANMCRFAGNSDMKELISFFNDEIMAVGDSDVEALDVPGVIGRLVM